MFSTNPNWAPKYIPEGRFPDGVLDCFRKADGQWLALYAEYLGQQTNVEDFRALDYFDHIQHVYNNYRSSNRQMDPMHGKFPLLAEGKDKDVVAQVEEIAKVLQDETWVSFKETIEIARKLNLDSGGRETGSSRLQSELAAAQGQQLSLRQQAEETFRLRDATFVSAKALFETIAAFKELGEQGGLAPSVMNLGDLSKLEKKARKRLTTLLEASQEIADASRDNSCDQFDAARARLEPAVAGYFHVKRSVLEHIYRSIKADANINREKAFAVNHPTAARFTVALKGISTACGVAAAVMAFTTGPLAVVPAAISAASGLAANALNSYYQSQDKDSQGLRAAGRPPARRGKLNDFEGPVDDKIRLAEAKTAAARKGGGIALKVLKKVNDTFEFELVGTSETFSALSQAANIATTAASTVIQGFNLPLRVYELVMSSTRLTYEELREVARYVEIQDLGKHAQDHRFEREVLTDTAINATKDTETRGLLLKAAQNFDQEGRWYQFKKTSYWVEGPQHCTVQSFSGTEFVSSGVRFAKGEDVRGTTTVRWKYDGNSIVIIDLPEVDTEEPDFPGQHKKLQDWANGSWRRTVVYGLANDLMQQGDDGRVEIRGPHAPEWMTLQVSLWNDFQARCYSAYMTLMARHFRDVDLEITMVNGSTYNSLSELLSDTSLFVPEFHGDDVSVLKLRSELELDDTKKRELSLKAAYYNRRSGSPHLADDEWPELPAA
ncbi:hypothetical protein SSP24_83330 [Streptomyces spinoverrucosus]|uniref:Uncharacterized protein n=1 Tax=Streptomyces spinoverrucosus TaxID=284043 RepID=A0A4Y3VWS7_9ACTN|nr:hypothetical protein [Streptomyces spinoverrucosus]GEC10678.1 hypothetical protein SSP24_83330 [Streptomyces spinoverrucosus]GHB99568.1 hypothetical protein GCM10010397_84680 [Streptomyces spinoverrucosus]